MSANDVNAAINGTIIRNVVLPFHCTINVARRPGPGMKDTVLVLHSLIIDLEN